MANEKIKVAEFDKGPSTCRHYRTTFTLSDGSIFNHAEHDDTEMTIEEERQLCTLWLKFMLKFKSDKTKIKNKSVVEVE